MREAFVSSANIYESAMTSLAAIAGAIAEKKNIALQPEGFEAVAERALEFMDLPVIYDFMALREGGIHAATRALNRSLDLYFAISVYACIGRLDQRDDFTPEAVEALGEQLIEKLIPADAPFYRWPDLTEMVARHYATGQPTPTPSNRRRTKNRKRTRGAGAARRQGKGKAR